MQESKTKYREQIATAVVQNAAVYGRLIEPDTVAIYIRHLEKWPLEVLEQGIDEAMQASPDWFPTWMRIDEKCKSVADELRQKAALEQERLALAEHHRMPQNERVPISKVFELAGKLRESMRYPNTIDGRVASQADAAKQLNRKSHHDADLVDKAQRRVASWREEKGK